eukprot:CAMPEP_0196652672 /NCGR_PEP_ID=MMETSP1086-20130531/2022_1 /TAXON_ID=77921 /ORGANISM="Cyanoptyche  gloeocystis , Strain SAG4.97" /LENGTH=147 /DNA_ID=CAMNT_0041983337 /DNA_START=147 /DNA_END=587 /DNA_ORIENTATION=+
MKRTLLTEKGFVFESKMKRTLLTRNGLFFFESKIKRTQLTSTWKFQLPLYRHPCRRKPLQRYKHALLDQEATYSVRRRNGKNDSEEKQSTIQRERLDQNALHDFTGRSPAEGLHRCAGATRDGRIAKSVARTNIRSRRGEPQPYASP